MCCFWAQLIQLLVLCSQLRVSFSMDGRIHSSQPQGADSVTSDLLDFFFNSVGATLTEIKDVELRYLIRATLHSVLIE